MPWIHLWPDQAVHRMPSVVRHDYDADVLGRSPASNVASGHREFGGIVFATQRRVTARTPNGAAATEPLLVSIDFADIQVQ
jgi:hypothetical protein